MTTNNNELTVFLDTIGRTILGTLAPTDKFGEENNKIGVINPAILNIMPTEDGKMQVQIIPIMFKELQGDRDQEIVWYYEPDNITMNGGFALDFKIASQYNAIFAGVQAGANPGPVTP